MNKNTNFLNKIEKKVMPFALKLANNTELTAVREAMYMLSPFLIVGSFFLLFVYLPIPGYSDFMISIFGQNWGSLVTKVTDSSFGIMTLLVILGTSYNYASMKGERSLIPAFSSLMTFFIITPFVEGNIPSQWIGSAGMLVGIATALLATNGFLFVKQKGLGPKFPDTVPTGVIDSFAALVPIAFLGIVAMLIEIIMLLTPFNDIHTFINTIVATPLLIASDTLFGEVFIEFIAQLLWVFGIHGNDVVLSVMRPIWLQMSAENLEAFKQGAELTNIVTQEFRNVYLLIGGSGATLPLVILMAFKAKSQHMKTIGKLALAPSIFNINEPVIFGVPIVLNPIMAIPFLICGPLFAAITYLAMDFGLVAMTNGIVIPWTTPIFINGFLVSGISGVILQVFLLLIGFIIYFPFIKMLDKEMLKEEGA